MRKDGDITLGYLVKLILAAIVLVTVLVIFTKGFDYLFDKIRWALSFVFDLSPKGL